MDGEKKGNGGHRGKKPPGCGDGQGHLLASGERNICPARKEHVAAQGRWGARGPFPAAPTKGKQIESTA